MIYRKKINEQMYLERDTKTKVAKFKEYTREKQKWEVDLISNGV